MPPAQGPGAEAPRRKAGIAAVALALAAGTGLFVLLLIRGSPLAPPAADVAVVPFEIVGALDADFGRDLARLATYRLEHTPGIRAAPIRIVFPEWDRLRGETNLNPRDPRAFARRLRVRYLVRGVATRSPAGVEVELEVVDSLRSRSPYHQRIRGHAPDLLQLSDGVAREVVRLLHPEFRHPPDRTPYEELPRAAPGARRATTPQVRGGASTRPTATRVPLRRRTLRSRRALRAAAGGRSAT